MSPSKRSYLNRILPVAALLIWTSCHSSAADAKEQYMMNGKLVSRSMYEAAILLKQGTQQLKANKNDEAIESLKQAESLAPDFPEVHHNLGIALAKLGRSQEAISQLEIARKLNPALPSTWLSLGGLYQTEGDIPRALEIYNQYLSKFPRDPAYSKVASLVKGLSSEEIMERASGNDPDNRDSNDYLREVTRQGVVRWSAGKMPLKVFIEAGDSVPSYRKELDALLRKSFLDWQEASGGLVSFQFTDDKDNSDIQCSWTEDPKTLKNIAEAGETRLYSNSKGIVRGTIKFLTVPLMKALPMTDNRMRYIFLHEIGHVMGMAGHTTVPTDAMFHSISMKDEWRNLSERDSNTLRKLYSQPGPSITYKKEL